MPPNFRLLSLASASEARAATEPVAYLPPHVTPRIGAQQALLTYHPNPAEPWTPSELIRYDIPTDIAFKLKIALAKAGINEAVLIPGLDGIAADLAWMYKREFLREVTLKSSSGKATDHGYAADGSRQFTVRMQKVPEDKKTD